MFRFSEFGIASNKTYLTIEIIALALSPIHNSEIQDEVQKSGCPVEREDFEIRQQNIQMKMTSMMATLSTTTAQRRMILCMMTFFLLQIQLVLSRLNDGSTRDHSEDTVCLYRSHGLNLLEVSLSKEQIPQGSTSFLNLNWHCQEMTSSSTVHQDTDRDLADCILQDERSCRENESGDCVWCAEPVAGMCVTSSIAQKIGNLPFFDCDDNLIHDHLNT